MAKARPGMPKHPITVLRERRGYTQRLLARWCDVTVACVSLTESGSVPRPAALLNALNVRLREPERSAFFAHWELWESLLREEQRQAQLVFTTETPQCPFVRIRLEQGRTQEEMAALIDVSLSVLTKAEAGAIARPFTMLAAFVAAFPELSKQEMAKEWAEWLAWRRKQCDRVDTKHSDDSLVSTVRRDVTPLWRECKAVTRRA